MNEVTDHNLTTIIMFTDINTIYTYINKLLT